MSDLIRREDVDKAIRSICDLCGEDKKYNGVMCGACNLDSFIREYEDIPSAEPERKWIPVSEELPEEDEEVLVTVLDDTGDTPWSYTSVGWRTPDGEYWVVDNEICYGVVAWMPLPEPWRGER